MKPGNFELVVKAALRCFIPSCADEEDLKSPSNALKIGHDVKRMVSAKLAQGVISEDEKNEKWLKIF